MTASLQYSVWWEERSLKFKFESWPPIIGGIMKVKRANRLMSIIDEIWVIHLQKVDTLLMIRIQDKYFHFIPVIMVLYIYKYWFKMSKWWKFPPLIKARASSTNYTMGNLICSRHATYIRLYLHTIYVKSREIHILSTIDNFIKPILGPQLQGAYKENIQTQR